MPRLQLCYRDEHRKTGPFLVYKNQVDRTGSKRFYGRIRSSHKKQCDDGLLEFIKQKIAAKGFYDPDEVQDAPSEDVS